MDVLFIINSLEAGGAEKLLCAFVGEISSKYGGDDNYSVLSIDSRNRVADLMYFQNLGVSYYSLGTSVYSPIALFRLAEFFKQKKFDLIHVHLFPSQYLVPLALLLARKRVKLVFTEHSTRNRRLNNFAFKGIERMIYKQYDKIIAISGTVKTLLDDWAGTDDRKIVIIHNGVELGKNSEGDPTSPFSGVGSGKRIVLMVARFARPKLQTLLIKSLKYLDKDIVVAFAGEGPLLADTKSVVSQLGYEDRVWFLGLRQDIPSLMRAADINILCSEFEGMSGVTLESMASGRPFIGSDVPGINDIVGTSLSLFQNDEKSLANKVLAVLNDHALKEVLVKENLRAVKQFSLESMVAKHRELYCTLLKD